MKVFRRLTAIAAPLLWDNIDTDAIIPSKEITSPSRQGMGEKLFANWRYQEGTREPQDDFILNTAPYDQAQILLGGRNFGCGSSREPAAWALEDFGIRCVIAPSFGSIFYVNCVRNGILPVVLPLDCIQAIASGLSRAQGKSITVDLVSCQVVAPYFTGQFTLEDQHRQALLQGLDPIGVTLKSLDQIENFEKQDCLERPWVYDFFPPSHCSLDANDP